MRPSLYTYTPAVASATGYATNVTGASWTLTATSPGDGLSHQVTIHNNSATDHSAKTVLISGLDVDGQTISETMHLPAGTSTTTSVNYYASITSPLIPSASIGVDTMNIGWTVTAFTPTFPCDRVSDTNLTMQFMLPSGTITCGLYELFENPFLMAANPSMSADWVQKGSNITAAGVYVADVNASAVRVTITTSSGPATIKIVYTQAPRSA